MRGWLGGLGAVWSQYVAGKKRGEWMGFVLSRVSKAKIAFFASGACAGTREPAGRPWGCGRHGRGAAGAGGRSGQAVVWHAAAAQVRTRWPCFLGSCADADAWRLKGADTGRGADGYPDRLDADTCSGCVHPILCMTTLTAGRLRTHGLWRGWRVTWRMCSPAVGWGR